MDDDQFAQVHLIKFKLVNKNINLLNVTCPYHQKFTPTVQLKGKSIAYVPLINKLMISKNLIRNSIKNQIPIDIQPLLQNPFDKHSIKIQTYEDQPRQIKGQVVNLHVQFSLFLTLKNDKNYVNVYFKYASLRKDLKLFGKMNPSILISNDQWNFKTKQIKDGHLNPRFEEEVLIPFNSVFDKLVIQLRDGEERIGYQAIYVFQLFGKNQEKELQLKKQHKIVGTLTYVVQQFQPQDF